MREERRLSVSSIESELRFRMEIGAMLKSESEVSESN